MLEITYRNASGGVKTDDFAVSDVKLTVETNGERTTIKLPDTTISCLNDVILQGMRHED